jgi:TetR/AcrR family transcriptional regulator
MSRNSPRQGASSSGAPDDAAVDEAARTENQSRILEVATREFAEKGLAGARVAEIAEQAGVNKQLLYYYFGSKEGLYSAVLGSMVSVSRNLILARADVDSLTDRYKKTINPESIERRRTMRRLWMWEALERGDRDILREEERREAWERAVDLVREAQERGEVDPALDPEMVMLALDGILNQPNMLPQVTKLITGLDPGDAAFRKRHRAFVDRFMKALAPRS